VNRALVLLALVAHLLCPAWAQDQPKIITIFDFKTELSLSPDQIQAMKSHLMALNTSVKQSRSKIAQLEKEFKALISQESSAEEARTKLQQIADATVAMRLTDFETSKKIMATLTPEQKAKWKSLQARLKVPATPSPTDSPK
jgi:Spy/CpxP family protein refolding chaperone